MNATPMPHLRRGPLAAAVATVGLLGLLPAGGVAHASSQSGAHNGSGCPAAESLVPQTTWHRHTLAPGIVMSGGTANDSRGTVNMHVMRVDLASKNVSVQPLVHSIAERLPLSTLVKGHSHLVAAINTGYFDFHYGAPTDPLISGRAPFVISSAHQEVVGLTPSGLMQAGHVWWSATLTAGTRTHSVVARNEVAPRTGLGIYTTRWGAAHVPGSWNSVSRDVVGGVVKSVSKSHNGLNVPTGGYLLVAHGSAASKWLSSLATGSKVTLSSSVETDAPKPFVQAYGVGVQVVARAGVAESGFSCDSISTKQPARTEIGFANGGRTLLVAIVADNPFTSMHGLDEDQMSMLMVQLGVSEAFAFDGSGSTELLAKLPHEALTLENYPADGQERAMPLGLGISSTPVKAKKKAKH